MLRTKPRSESTTKVSPRQSSEENLQHQWRSKANATAAAEERRAAAKGAVRVEAPEVGLGAGASAAAAAAPARVAAAAIAATRRRETVLASATAIGRTGVASGESSEGRLGLWSAAGNARGGIYIGYRVEDEVAGTVSGTCFAVTHSFTWHWLMENGTHLISNYNNT
ncbi:hypothetical protein Cni_G07300 [Canna indica]|uniref:Uncharacterized protein n=1 Tax=Canna indica TaxID=4628 RepID=A0AAQ3Q5L4_9LILI|nr:hypothetical protein Cni_G07300 [Canna indica]